LFSIILSFANRYVFGILHFPLTLTATSVHFLGQYVFAYFYTTCSSSSSSIRSLFFLRRKQTITINDDEVEELEGVVMIDNNNNESSTTTENNNDDETIDDDPLVLYSNLSRRSYMELALWVGVSSALDIAGSNLGMSLVPISVYTIVKASVPIFVLALSFALKLNEPSINLCMVFILITIGEVLATSKSSSSDNEVNTNTTFLATTTKTIIDPLACTYYYDNELLENKSEADENEDAHHQIVKGIIIILGASFFSALRWTMLQYKLSSVLPKPLQTPMMTLRIISPAMFLTLFPIALYLEQHKFQYVHTCSYVTTFVGFTNGLLAIPLMLAEYSLLIQSSAVVLMIGGVCKEVVTIILGVAVFHEIVKRRSWIGFSIITCGALLYKLDKIKKKDNDETTTTHQKGTTTIEMAGGKRTNNKQTYFTIDEEDDDEYTDTGDNGQLT